jgi:hypothetical protein
VNLAPKLVEGQSHVLLRFEALRHVHLGSRRRHEELRQCREDDADDREDDEHLAERVTMLSGEATPGGRGAPAEAHHARRSAGGASP